MSRAETRTVIAAQILAAMSASVTSNATDEFLKEKAEVAVRLAQALEEAIGRSLNK